MFSYRFSSAKLLTNVKFLKSLENVPLITYFSIILLVHIYNIQFVSREQVHLQLNFCELGLHLSLPQELYYIDGSTANSNKDCKHRKLYLIIYIRKYYRRMDVISENAWNLELKSIVITLIT